ncbi:MAG TPA: tripartite tricarboxylate transporter substrate binding protein [Burkholderiales bacterium]|jgi:tripartite-type tricarboxylate transporter receptor subunit TctC
MRIRTSRTVLWITGFVLALIVTATIAAEPWPNRPVRLIVPFGSASAPDVAARLYAEQLTARWKRPVIVDNRTGAEGLIGVTAFAGMRDDHVLLFSPAAPISVFPLTHEKLAYDPAQDFVPISSAIDTFGTVAVSASVKVASLIELVTLARAQPGKLNWTSSGGAFQILMAGFTRTAGVDLVEVPYRDQGLAIQDLAGGRIHVLATTLTPLLPFVQAGKVRLLAVTNKKRAPTVPELPTALEAGHAELEFEGLVGFFGWRDMPKTLRDRISADVRASAGDTNLVARLATAGQLPHASTAAEFAAAIEEQRARMEALVRLTRKPKQ